MSLRTQFNLIASLTENALSSLIASACSRGLPCSAERHTLEFRCSKVKISGNFPHIYSLTLATFMEIYNVAWQFDKFNIFLSYRKLLTEDQFKVTLWISFCNYPRGRLLNIRGKPKSDEQKQNTNRYFIMDDFIRQTAPIKTISSKILTLRLTRQSTSIVISCTSS